MNKNSALKRIRKYLEGDRDSPGFNESLLYLVSYLNATELNESEKNLLSEAMRFEVKRCTRYSRQFKDKRYKDFSISLSDKLQTLIDEEL